MSRFVLIAAAFVSVIVASACGRSTSSVSRPPVTQSTDTSAATATSWSPGAWREASCRVLRPGQDGCRTGETARPSRGRSRAGLLTTDGRAVFHFGRRERFDVSSFRFASVVDCPLWEDVFAWDRHDVYALAPQSCGPRTCGSDDYRGFYWVPLGVRAPRSFRWLPGAYGTDGRFIYSRWNEGPIADAIPERFEVLLCGGEEGVVFGWNGDHLYRDGRPISEEDARAALTGESAR